MEDFTVMTILKCKPFMLEMTSNVGNQLSVPTHDLEKAMEGCAFQKFTSKV